MPDAVAPTPPVSKLKIFVRRLTSTILLWGVVVAAMFSTNRFISDNFFLAAMVFLAVTGLTEFYGLVQKRNLVCFANWGIFGGVLLMGGTFFQLTGHIGTQGSPARVNDFEMDFLILFVLGLCLRQFFSKSNTAGILAISTTLFGLMYVPWLLNFVQKIQFFTFPESHIGTGKYYVLFFILVTKFSDTGAYVFGSLFGKHKMIPRISPAKTWEGFAGAIFSATLTSLVFTHFLADKMFGMKWPHAIILGVILSVCAVVGDLIESIFKREAGVKDSGNLFPGIGGILDLLDSLLFNAPIMYLYLRHVLTHP